MADCGPVRHISIHAPREGSDDKLGDALDKSGQFLSTLPARGATYFSLRTGKGEQGISIHAPREGSDKVVDYGRKICLISIHAPREGSDQAPPVGAPRRGPFLSTLPARGATITDSETRRAQIFLSTLPARGATAVEPPNDAGYIISIHAPREGSDLRPGGVPACRLISIHAPREGSD